MFAKVIFAMFLALTLIAVIGISMPVQAANVGYYQSSSSYYPSGGNRYGWGYPYGYGYGYGGSYRGYNQNSTMYSDGSAMTTHGCVTTPARGGYGWGGWGGNGYGWGGTPAQTTCY